jgi:hypothetical protein
MNTLNTWAIKPHEPIVKRWPQVREVLLEQLKSDEASDLESINVFRRGKSGDRLECAVTIVLTGRVRILTQLVRALVSPVRAQYILWYQAYILWVGRKLLDNLYSLWRRTCTGHVHGPVHCKSLQSPRGPRSINNDH